MDIWGLLGLVAAIGVLVESPNSNELKLKWKLTQYYENIVSVICDPHLRRDCKDVVAKQILIKTDDNPAIRILSDGKSYLTINSTLHVTTAFDKDGYFPTAGYLTFISPGHRKLQKMKDSMVTVFIQAVCSKAFLCYRKRGVRAVTETQFDKWFDLMEKGNKTYLKKIKSCTWYEKRLDDESSKLGDYKYYTFNKFKVCCKTRHVGKGRKNKKKCSKRGRLGLGNADGKLVGLSYRNAKRRNARGKFTKGAYNISNKCSQSLSTRFVKHTLKAEPEDNDLLV